MRRLLALALAFAAGTAGAQIYRWVDAKGTIHYSNGTPPPGVKAVVVDPSAKEATAAPESGECYTIRCQGERMEERQRRREELESRLAAERQAAAPKPPRGLDFRKYVSLQRGMSEGELLVIAGEPDFLSRPGIGLRTWTYLPTVADPFTTTITVIGGRISEIERVRKF